jgi:hypothetical protein
MIQLSERQLNILKAVARHYLLTAAQIKRLVFALGKDPDGRHTRRLLASLVGQRLLNKSQMEAVHSVNGGFNAPVYFPSRGGGEVLAAHTGDLKWLLTPTRAPVHQNIPHWLCLSDLRITIDAALAAQSLVEMPHFYNEFDVVNPDAGRPPADRFRLYTLIPGPKKVCCVPDAAFLLRAGTACKAYYVEIERMNDPWHSASKAQGYAGLAAHGLWRRHFPEAPDFGVLVFAVNAGHREALRKAYGKKEGAQRYKFAALKDVTPETFLHGPVFHPAGDGLPVALVEVGR